MQKKKPFFFSFSSASKFGVAKVRYFYFKQQKKCRKPYGLQHFFMFRLITNAFTLL